MNIESITTLEEARDFLAARYPKQTVNVDRSIWVNATGHHTDNYSASIFVGDEHLVSGRGHSNVRSAVKEAMEKAEDYDPAEIAKREVKAARAKLEAAGFSVISPDA